MSRRGTNYVNNDLIDLCAYLVLVISGTLLLVTFILDRVGGNLGSITGVLNFIRDLAFFVGIGLAAYRFTKGKGKAVRILYWIALVVYIVFVILGFTLPVKG